MHVIRRFQVATLPVAVNQASDLSFHLWCQVQYHVGMGTAGRLATDDKEYMPLGLFLFSFI